MKTAERIYQRLKQEIQNHELKPGSPISIVELSKRFQISPTPVREALSRLEQESLILSRHNRKIVFILSIAEINQIFDLKKSIESSIAALAVERGEEKSFMEFGNLLTQIKIFNESLGQFSDTDGDKLSTWLNLDRTYHDYLYQMAQNTKAQEIIALLNLQWHRFRLALLSLPGMLKKSIEEHIEIGNAIASREKEESEKLMRAHLETLHHSLITVVAPFNPQLD